MKRQKGLIAIVALGVLLFDTGRLQAQTQGLARTPAAVKANETLIPTPQEQGKTQDVLKPSAISSLNLDKGVSHLKTLFKSSFRKGVKVYKRTGKTTALIESFSVNYNPAAKQAPFAIEGKIKRAPLQPSATALTWLNSFLSDSKILTQLVDIKPLSSAKIPGLSGTEGLKRYLILPKVKLENVHHAYVYLDQNDAVKLVEIKHNSKGFLIYDFSGLLKPGQKSKTLK